MAKKMIDYLPPFMQQFEEMKQLMQSEDKQVAALNMDTTKSELSNIAIFFFIASSFSSR